MIQRRTTLLIATPFALMTSIAATEAANARDAPTPAVIVARACDARPQQEVTMLRLGEALLIEAGKMPSDFVADNSVASYGEALVGRLGRISRGEESEPPGDAFLLLGTIDTFEEALRAKRPGQKPPLILEGQVPPQGRLLFQSTTSPWKFRCKPADPSRTFIQEVEEFTPPPAFSVRSTPEELALTGEERLNAGAFALGFDRTQTTLDDGSRKTETNFAISGTAGIRLTSAKSQRSTSYLYGRYELKQGRTSPTPTLAPGASQSDGDTDVFEGGLSLETRLTGNANPIKLFLDAQAGAVFDFANNSDRLKFKALIRPVFPGSIRICGIERYQVLIKSIDLKARCRFQFELEAAKVLKQGRSPLGTFDTFLAAGGRAEFQAFLPTAKGMGFLAGVNYRLLPVIHGAPDEIERLEMSLKHRFWAEGDVGIDVGFSYTKGTNELSFEEEDVLKFGLGIIY